MGKQFFVGIGAQRAGTSWLAEYLLEHPQIGMSPIKELHYFDVIYRKDLCKFYEKRLENVLINVASQIKNDFSEQTVKKLSLISIRMEMKNNPRRYKDYFNLVAEKQHRIIGEITPSYSLLNEDGFEAIRNMYNHAKFVFILRDPVDRYWSQLKHNKLMSEPVTFNIEDDIIKCLSAPHFYLRSDYKRTLTELYKVAPTKDVCVVFFENLMSPEAHDNELKKITGFLGIDHIKSDLTNKYNASKSKDL